MFFLAHQTNKKKSASMASRPLPPGRRGRGPRVASGLHHLPEVKLLDVPKSFSDTRSAPVRSAPVVNAAVEPQAPASTDIMKATSFHPAAEPQHAVVELQSTAHKTPVPSVASADAAAPAVVAMPVKRAVVEHPAVTTLVPSPAYQYQPPHVPTTVAPPVQNTLIRSPSIKAPAETSTPVSKPIMSPSPAAAALAVTTPASTAAPASQTATDLGEFHPFYLLLPVDAVPSVPESVECIYDEAAVEMQKNVLKVIKKLLSRDKMKLEDFKINSRLFGNNFMEPYEYLESLVKDFGDIRALQLVPCLLAIQVDFMKRSGLLLAARNYRMRHLITLEAQCQALRAVEAVPAPAPQSIAPPIQPLPVPTAPVAVKVAEAAVQDAVEKSDDPREEEKFVVETAVCASLSEEVAPEQKAEVAMFAALVGSEAVATTTTAAHSADGTDEGDALGATTVTAASSGVASTSPDSVVEEAGDEVHESPASQVLAIHSSIAHVETESDMVQPLNKPELSYKSVEPSAEIVQFAVAIEPKPAEAEADEVVPKSTFSSQADAELDSGVDMLPAAFRQAFASYDSEPVVTAKPASVQAAEPTNSSSKTYKVDVEPTSMSSTLSSSSSNVPEAENHFEERLSTGSTSSENADNLFGESMFQPSATPTASAAVSATVTESSVAAATPSFPAPKRVHSQLLFGFATAGADTDSDSDSDDSGFSSS